MHANLNPDLQIIGLLRVMFDPRITLQQQVSEQLKAHFGDKVFDTVIPRNVRLAEAPSYGMPGVVFDPASKGALAFLEFAREMAARADALRASRSLSTAPTTRAFDEALLARIEDAGINASAPRAAALGRRLAGPLLARQGQARALHQRGRAGPARRSTPSSPLCLPLFAAAGCCR